MAFPTGWLVDALACGRSDIGDEWDGWVEETTPVSQDYVLDTGVVVTDVSAGTEYGPLQLTFTFATETERNALRAKRDGLPHTVTSPSGYSDTFVLQRTKRRNTADGLRKLETTWLKVTT